jgi:outer membrane lipoprotein-sorting protein
MSARPLCLFLLTACITCADEVAPLRAALEMQAQHGTVSVKVRQTKKIPALTEEIALTGHLWLKPGKAFRWELGDPLVQSAVYDGKTVFLMDEKDKTAVALDPGDRRAKPLLLMLGFGEGASFEKMQESFTVGSTNTVDEHFVVSLMPKGGVRRALKSMVMQFNIRTSFPERIEWVQKDGTIVVTEFFPPAIDGKLPAGIFDVKREAYAWE